MEKNNIKYSNLEIHFDGDDKPISIHGYDVNDRNIYTIRASKQNVLEIIMKTYGGKIGYYGGEDYQPIQWFVGFEKARSFKISGRVDIIEHKKLKIK